MIDRDDYNARVAQFAGQAGRHQHFPGGRILRSVNWLIVAGFVAVLVVLGILLARLQVNADGSDPAVAGPLTLAFVIVGWVFSLCLHEFGHAATAVLGGDDSLSTQRYLSFNPVDYVNPLFSIILPLVFLLIGGIGLPGGAVYLQRNRLRNSNWQTYVSLAGPFANLVFTLLLIVPEQYAVRSGDQYLAGALAVLAFFEIFAVILNLLPIPPLDGYHAIQDWLPVSWQYSPWVTGGYGVMLLFLAFWLVRPLGNAFFTVCSNIIMHLGFDPFALLVGYGNLFFWQR